MSQDHYHYIKYSRATGLPVTAGYSSARSEAFNQADDEHAVVLVDGDAQATIEVEVNGQRFTTTVPDMEAVRRTYLRRIDHDATTLTADPFAAIHAAKLIEAKADGERPILTAEAEVTDRPIAAIVAEVIANAEASAVRRARIEVQRIAAKRAVREAGNVLEIIRAADVQWEN